MGVTKHGKRHLRRGQEPSSYAKQEEAMSKALSSANFMTSLPRPRQRRPETPAAAARKTSPRPVLLQCAESGDHLSRSVPGGVFTPGRGGRVFLGRGDPRRRRRHRPHRRRAHGAPWRRQTEPQPGARESRGGPHPAPPLSGTSHYFYINV